MTSSDQNLALRYHDNVTLELEAGATRTKVLRKPKASVYPLKISLTKMHCVTVALELAKLLLLGKAPVVRKRVCEASSN